MHAPPAPTGDRDGAGALLAWAIVALLAAVDAAPYDPPGESLDDDADEPGDPTSPPRPRITVSSTQPTIVNRPTKPTSEGASGRPQPQHKPRIQRKK